jgi:chromosome segregation ATPase
LTIRNLAAEAEVSKDTPLSKYREDHPQAGEYRFPKVEARFNTLKKKLHDGPGPENIKDRKIKELRERNEELEEQLVLSHRANNKLDTELYEKDRYIRELEEQATTLRRDSLRVLPSVKERSGK